MNIYKVFINSVRDDYEFSFDYKYINKSINIKISLDSAVISLDRTTDYYPDKIAMGINNVFSEAVKKTILIHLLIYSKSLDVSVMTIHKNKKIYDYSLADKNMAQVFSLVKGELHTPFSAEWRNKEFIETILNLKKEDYDSRMSSLFAVICAKNKVYEVERFVNFWISFNGMYGFFSSLFTSKTSYETEQLKRFIIYLLDEGNHRILRDLSNVIAKKVTDLLGNYPIDEIDHRWLNDEANQKINAEFLSIVQTEVKNRLALAEEERKKSTDKKRTPKGDKIKLLNEMLNYDNTIYAYLLVEYAYFFRCKYIHANEVLPLLCYENEHEVKCIALVNRLLEDYISSTLCNWFLNDYIESTLRPLANE